MKRNNYYRNTKTTGGQPVLLADGRTAGYLTNDGKVFLKRINDKNILRYPPALCLDRTVLFKLQRFGVRTIVIKHKIDGTVWSLPLEKFLEKTFGINRGMAGSQQCVRLQHWQVEGNNAPNNAPAKPLSPLSNTAKAQPIQQRLVV
ncbi:MAG: hypothetical protein C4562_05370 [Actinobacteria bacterium]|nr:MAG: hypothetical protein C4562_05370 [Actinomycetota bacterium]